MWFYAVRTAGSANWVVTGHATMPTPATPDTTPGAGETLGRRIARLRSSLGLTQADLAARVAISRVALSNLESDRSVAGERTVALLAGVFGTEATDLVAGTDYPSAKAERLPLVVARHTEVDLRLALLDRDLRWMEGAPRAVAERVRAEWRTELTALHAEVADLGERARVRHALEGLAAV